MAKKTRGCWVLWHALVLGGQIKLFRGPDSDSFGALRGARLSQGACCGEADTFEDRFEPRVTDVAKRTDVCFRRYTKNVPELHRFWKVFLAAPIMAV